MIEPIEGINIPRCLRLVEMAIADFRLDLRSLSVLTEAATGYYALTPVIAALAGADEVFLLARDSRFGEAGEVVRHVEAAADLFGVADRLTPLNDRADHRVGEADVVTNLGHVRPLDGTMLARLKETAAVSLMCETWEYRPDDLDLEVARKLGIPVLGTNERHPRLRTLEYVGHIAAKLLYESDIEILGCRVAVVGDHIFGAEVEKVLAAAGADVLFFPTGEWDTTDAMWTAALPALDALVIAEHHVRTTLVAPDALVEPFTLRAANPGLVIVHIAGGVDANGLDVEGIRYVPRKIAAAGRMSLATDFVGPKPMIDLHTAGLRVGAELAHMRLRGYSRIDAEREALARCSLCQEFEDEPSHGA